MLDRGYGLGSSVRLASGRQLLRDPRAKRNLKFKRRYSHAVDRQATSVICDQSGVLTVYYSSRDYPQPLARIVVKDIESGKRLTFLTNNTTVLQPR